MDKQNDSIKLLVELAQEGDSDAFSQIYDAYHSRIINYTFRRILDTDSAEDITSDVFVKVIKGLKKFKWKHEHSFSGWIFRIASNEVNQFLRVKKLRSFVRPLSIDDIAHDFDRTENEKKGIELIIDSDTAYTELHRCIVKLKPKQQNLIHMYFFEDLCHKEISIALKMKEATVRVAVHRAVESLRKLISMQSSRILIENLSNEEYKNVR